MATNEQIPDEDGWVYEELDDADIALIKERLKGPSIRITLEELMNR